MSTHPPCSREGCNRPRYTAGLCSAHHQRKRRGVEMDTPIRNGPGPERPCSLPGCSRPSRAHGLCITHYDRKRVGHPAWDKPIVRRAGMVDRASLGKASRKLVEKLDRIAKSRGLTRAILLDSMLERYLGERAPL